MTISEKNAQTLERELAWFIRVLDTRIALHFEQACELDDISQVVMPVLDDDDSPYASIIKQHQLGFDERIVLLLALIPHIRPEALDTLFLRNKNLERGYTEFGGWKGNTHGGFLPTGETAAFILAASDLVRRFEVFQLFESEHLFAQNKILSLQRQSDNEPFFSGALIIAHDYLELSTSGTSHKPDYSINFPAKRITTRLGWEDLVLAPSVLEEIDTIMTWMKHSTTIMEEWGLGKSLKPGYRGLFYGPPGTGKTLTASLMGAELGADVYRIDLSMVVSKYIGETEKNLANVFDQAESKNWILFFDEADALFGKRTQASSSNDRHANQEISYLLQRVEDYPGVVILATNLKANIDEAFARRFQSLVYFPVPDAEHRKQLWLGAFNGQSKLAADVDIDTLSTDHELSGGGIINVVRYGAISALKDGRNSINSSDLINGISKELRKEGRTI